MYKSHYYNEEKETSDSIFATWIGEHLTNGTMTVKVWGEGVRGVPKRGEQNNISFKSNLQLRTIKLLESFHTVLWWRSAETTMRFGSVGGIGGGDTTSKIKFCTEIMFSGNFYCCSMNVCLWIVFQKIWYDRLRCAERDFQHAHFRTNTIIIFIDKRCFSFAPLPNYWVSVW